MAVMRKEILIGYCHVCCQVHSTDEATRRLEGKKTHCQCCKQELPKEQQLSGQYVWECNRTGTELVNIFVPPLVYEVPVEESELA
jgi:ATP sulfurylase